jgi:hypothetical protein
MSQINVDIVQPFTSGSDIVTVSGINISKPTVANPSHYNIAIGEGSLESLTSNLGNVAIGKQSLNFLTGGAHNISIGQEAGYYLQTHPSIPSLSGSGNIFLGVQAGANLVYGNKNIIIGGSSLSSSTLQSGSNNILLGDLALPSSNTVSNEITLGNFSVAALRCNVTSITSLSDARDKKDVTDLRAGLDFVKSLRPVEFVWDDRNEEGRHDVPDFGFIAQDLKAAQEDADMAETLKLVYESNPERLEASYGKLVPVLVQAIKDLAAEVETLKNK